MPAATTLTDASVTRLPTPTGSRVEYFCRREPGFGIRVSPSRDGRDPRRVWFVLYRFAGQQRRVTLGPSTLVTADEAREQARRIKRDAMNGTDAAATRAATKVATIAVATVVDRYISEHASRRAKSWQNMQKVLRRHVVPAWGRRDAASITRIDVRNWLAKLPPGPGQNRVLSMARSMFAWAEGQDLITTQPFAGIRAVEPERSRDRVLSDAELAAIWNAAGKLRDPGAGAYVRILLLTGQRRSEVAGMRWAEIDHAAAVWTLPRSAMKSSISHEVPLADAVMQIITAQPRSLTGPYVFAPGSAKPRKNFAQIKAALGLLTGPMEPWRLHDLRRTAATGMARLGVPTSTIARVLAHAQGGVTSRYDRYAYLPEKRAALAAWAGHVALVVAP